jgi:hypothetical protein
VSSLITPFHLFFSFFSQFDWILLPRRLDQCDRGRVRAWSAVFGRLEPAAELHGRHILRDARHAESVHARCILLDCRPVGAQRCMLSWTFLPRRRRANDAESDGQFLRHCGHGRVLVVQCRILLQCDCAHGAGRTLHRRLLLPFGLNAAQRAWPVLARLPLPDWRESHHVRRRILLPERGHVGRDARRLVRGGFLLSFGLITAYRRRPVRGLVLLPKRFVLVHGRRFLQRRFLLRGRIIECDAGAVRRGLFLPAWIGRRDRQWSMHAGL